MTKLKCEALSSPIPHAHMYNLVQLLFHRQLNFQLCRLILVKAAQSLITEDDGVVVSTSEMRGRRQGIGQE